MKLRSHNNPFTVQSAILFYDQCSIIKENVSGDSFTAHFEDLNDRELWRAGGIKMK